MTIAAIKAFGTKLQRGDGATVEVFVDVAEVLNIDGPGLSLDAIEVGNDAAGARLFIGGLLDAGEVSFELNFIPTDATQSASAGMLKDMIDRKVRTFKLVFPDTGATTWTMKALVTKFSPTASFDKQLTAAVTLKVSGLPTFA